ncbi:MAG TPA: HypC/HybG/HupF family hydrogenase formation chaperone [Phycisphaerae bacterium]|nr:HypC/HybG/HupF family hydrogenase formation chaperone [Phycisphaerae bacterium]HRR84081.1 HypC/HybG/HupF family hydrogenase formation chaperone [Phycisphaerae bacterium]
MCLAVPGRVLDIRTPESGAPMSTVGTVDFQGTRLEVGLAFTPEAKVGDWVLVHAGYALSVLDEAEAMQTWTYLKAAGLADLPPELSGGQ